MISILRSSLVPYGKVHLPLDRPAFPYMQRVPCSWLPLRQLFRERIMDHGALMVQGLDISYSPQECHVVQAS